MKRLLNIIILFCFSFSLLGYYPVFLILRYEIRHDIKQQIKAGLPTEMLTLFVFDKQTYAEIDWKEEGEFRLSGEMYDVVRDSTDDSGRIFVYCIRDEAEGDLYCQLDKEVREYSEKSTNAKGRPDVVKILSVYYLYTTLSHKAFHPVKMPFIWCCHVNGVPSLIQEVPAPPPEFV